MSKNPKMSKRKRQDARHEEIENDEDVGAENFEDDGSDDQSDGFFLSNKKKKSQLNLQETADEKRVRMAEKYLEQLKKQKQTEEEEEDEDDGDVLAQRLTTKLLKDRGKIAQRRVNFKEGTVTILSENKDQQNGLQDNQKPKETERVKSYKPGHQKSITCVAISSDDQYIYSVSHDSLIIKWEMGTGKRQKFPAPKYKTKRPRILCMSLSSDNEYLATSGSETMIHIWKTSSLSLHHTFNSGHRGPIYGLSFQRGSHQLYSGSTDRTVKIFSVDDKAYIDTLFGHQSEVVDIDSFQRERALSSGTDGSSHVWKIGEQSQLIFRSPSSSTDCVKVLNENHFISASQDGVLYLWSLTKKNPLARVTEAHGISTSGVPNWISSIATLRNSDLIATGSCNGEIKIWKLNLQNPSFTHLATIAETNGWVNSLQFSASANYLIAGLGREHRLGRWQPISDGRNRVVIVTLP